MSLVDLDDAAMILELAVLESSEVTLSGKLDWSPKKNWIEQSGGLPSYIEKLALGMIKGGMDRSKAIAIAISRIKVWAAGGGKVDADTKAKSVQALAQWTALKAKNKARKKN